MKKLFLMFAVAAAFTACNNAETKTESTADTTKVDTSSTMMAPPTVDTAMKATMDTMAKKMDTTMKMVDTTKK